MLKFTEYVPASQIWTNAEDHVDCGVIPGLSRGYNIEVKDKNGTHWMSAEWIKGLPEEEFDDEYHRWSRADWGLEVTGRICFRGYGVEKYDHAERDFYIKEMPDVLAKAIKEWLDKC